MNEIDSAIKEYSRLKRKKKRIEDKDHSAASTEVKKASKSKWTDEYKKEYQREYARQNKEYRRKYAALWREKNREHYRKYQKEYHERMRKNNDKV